MFLHGKKSTIELLISLQEKGLLKEDVVIPKRAEQDSVLKEIGNSTTPYGSVVQNSIAPGATNNVQFVHPLAWIYYVSSVRSGFAQLLRDVSEGRSKAF